MELKIIDKTEDEMHLEIIGENHTLLNMLKSALLDDQRVQIATYDMKHVSISDPILFVKTDGADPIGVVKDAANSMVAQCDEFMSIFKTAVDV
ncbi:DNA-directed RNA polymerase subunit L [Methanolobus sp.]|jgi:DNA-directed RNA polymerase subunit L|uniref:DNA-directed RNA polymerase subunit L n=1 Tax=Methanolobus sp. TaxID=1874737 RepID=UPI0025F549E9|nr:DNA-directed RNA polymerase subunit L [Methanolobus sp.]